MFFDGAAFGALPTLVGRKRVAQANSYVWTVQSLAEVVVPSLAGLALAVLHPATLLSIDALSFAASALLLAGIARPLQDDSRARPPFSLRGIAADIGEGLGYLWRHAGIRTMTIVGFTQCVAGGGFVSLMVVWSDRQLGIGTEGLRFGLVYGSWAVGSIVASLSLPRLLRGTTPARVTLLALPFSAVLGVVTPAWTDWRLGALSLMVWSVFYTTVVINSISYRQEVTPEPLLGRVNTAGRMLSWGVGWTGGAFLAGVLAGLVGVQATMFACTAASFVGVLVAWTSPLARARELAVEGEQPA